MLTNGENAVKRVIAALSGGSDACRELMVQLIPNDYKSVEIMLDCENGKVVTLGELTPEWWL